MQKAQVFLREDQQAQLREIALRTGRKQSELIRKGVDLVIERELQNESDWRSTLREIHGIWKDREDLDALYSGIRDDLNSRNMKLHGEQ